jgi:hypothetical protein
MHLSSKAVASLEKLSKLSEASQKKKLGSELFEKAKPFFAQAKLKTATLTDEQKAMIPPWILALLVDLGTKLAKRLLERLGITV